MAVVTSLANSGTDGRQLLLEGVALWSTNVASFGLWFWALDRGGPIKRLSNCPGQGDFRFPQQDSGEPDSGWVPQLLDYIYLSFTNSIAFSPTDAMPLSARAKLLMMTESAISVVTVLVVTARAVNNFQ
jgi:hypothetical protein